MAISVWLSDFTNGSRWTSQSECGAYWVSVAHRTSKSDSHSKQNAKVALVSGCDFLFVQSERAKSQILTHAVAPAIKIAPPHATACEDDEIKDSE